MDPGIRVTRLNASKFDFILNSIRTVYSNAEMSKMITSEQADDGGGDHKCELEITKCALKMLEHLVHRNSLNNDGFVGLFLNSIRSFHKAHRCSTKTAILFSIVLWKRMCLTDLSAMSWDQASVVRKFVEYLHELLDQAICIVRTNSTIRISVSENGNMKK